MRTEVIHDDDIAGLQRGTEYRIEVGEEDLRIRGRLDGHGGDHATQAHRAQDGEDLPVAFGRGFADTPPQPSPSLALGHLRRDTAFIQENQPFWSDRPQLFYELFAALTVRFRVALGGVERLFFRRKPSSPTIFQRCGVLTEMPAVACNSVCNSRRYRSG